MTTTEKAFVLTFAPLLGLALIGASLRIYRHFKRKSGAERNK